MSTTIKKLSRDYVPQIFELLPNRQYYCQFQCGKVLRNRAAFVKHLEVIHGVPENNFERFLCPVKNCTYNSRVIHLLRRHYQNHHVEKIYKCDICKRKFILETQLKNHKCGAHEYSCEICSKKFNKLCSRNRHVKACFKRESAPDLTANGMRNFQIRENLTLEEFARYLHNKPVKDQGSIKKEPDLENGITETGEAKSNVDIFIEKFEKLKDQELCVKKESVPEIDITKMENAKLNDDVFIEEFEQLLRNIENNTTKDPDLIKELANITPLLLFLQSNV